jgi:hypothetical protein
MGHGTGLQYNPRIAPWTWARVCADCWKLEILIVRDYSVRNKKLPDIAIAIDTAIIDSKLRIPRYIVNFKKNATPTGPQRTDVDLALHSNQGFCHFTQHPCWNCVLRVCC